MCNAELHYSKFKVNKCLSTSDTIHTKTIEKLWEIRQECDFSLVLKVCKEFDDVTSAGKLFHVCAAATGNARSPTVDSRVDGTSNADVDDDRKRRRPGILATG